MIIPPYLKSGDSVAIIATARKVSKEEIQPAIKILNGWGLKVTEGKNLYQSQFQFAGSDEQRLEDLQNELNNKNSKAILFARGGYGTMRIVNDVIFSKLKKNPKWLIGFSDVTTLHLLTNNLGIETLHAPMAINFSKAPAPIINSLKEILFGKKYNIHLDANRLNKIGKVKGKLVGGNLSLLYAGITTLPSEFFKNSILFIEDLDEYLYHIDRMMVALKNANVLKQINGLIVGGMNDMRDNTKAFGFKTDNPFGKTAEEIILEHVAEYKYPVCFNFPAGHIPNNNPLILGREVELNVGNENVSLNLPNNLIT